MNMNSQVWLDLGRGLLNHYLVNFGEVDKQSLVNELYGHVDIPDCRQKTMIEIAVLAHAKKIITSLCSTIKLDAVCKNDHQLSLDGFKHLFDAYPCKQSDGSVMIKMRSNMSIEEIDAKIIELEKMKMGVTLHIDEFKHYREILLRPETVAANDALFTENETNKGLS